MSKEKIFLPLMFLAMIFWGASWAFSKILITYADAYIITFWRFFFAFLGGVPLIYLLGISLRINFVFLKWILIASVCNCIYSLLYFIALAYGSAGKGGVLVTTLTPIFSYLLTFALIHYYAKKHGEIKESPRKNEIIGLVLGIISGVCLLDLGSIGDIFGKFNVLFILAALDWAIMSLFTQKIRIHPIAINFYVTFFSMLFFSPILLLPQSWEVLHSDLRFWYSMGAVAILSTTVGTSIYYLGIQFVGVAKGNAFMLLVPASALLCSYIFLGEVPSWLTIFGAILAGIAIYLINVYRPKDKKILTT